MHDSQALHLCRDGLHPVSSRAKSLLGAAAVRGDSTPKTLEGRKSLVKLIGSTVGGKVVSIRKCACVCVFVLTIEAVFHD